MIKNKCYFVSASLVLMLSFDVFSAEPKVCFYTKDNYEGNAICSTQGNAVEQLPTDWNDKISSIYIPNGMVVTVFKNEDFSGRLLTFKKSVDSLSRPQWANMNHAISSFKIRSAACFYESDHFSGESICLSGNERVDLYSSRETIRSKSHVLEPLNDRISSIKIPEHTQVTVYEDNGYSGKHFVLTNDFSYSELAAIGMSDDITSIKVSQQEHFICDQYCVVKGIYFIPIGGAFGSYWLDDRIKYKEALVSFKLSDKDNYTMELINGDIIKVVGRVILLVNKDNPENSFIFELSDESDTLSFLSRFNGGYFEIQFVESIGSEAIHISPLVGSLFDFGAVNVSFIVNNLNENQLLIINKIVLTVEKDVVRTERSFVGNAVCWLLPIISIYNYVVQGRCNQVDRFVSKANNFFGRKDNKILQISGSAKPLPKINDNDPDDFETFKKNYTTSIEGTLTHIDIDMQSNALTLPATALACKVSMKGQLLPHLRRRRDLTSQCIDWTLNIMTDFTLLYGDSIDSWNAENFGRVIERIIKEGDIGHTPPNSATETRLIENVKAHLSENEARALHIKTAFDFAQLIYTNYLQHNATELATHSPSRVQEFPLGRYTLALQNFQFSETVPRIRREGQWVEDPELHFEIEVISGAVDDTQVARQNVQPVIDKWRQIYHQIKKPPAATPSGSTDNPQVAGEAAASSAVIASVDDTVITASRLTSDVAQSWFRTSNDKYIYVIVRLAGKIISITMAIDINESDVGIAASLTHPDYVLHPHAEGTVRGAGTAAIRALADYLSKKGKRFLVSEVISQPSAIVKKKVGFKFVDEH